MIINNLKPFNSKYGGSYDVYAKINTEEKSINLFCQEDNTPFAKASVQIKDLESNEIAIKNYSENEGILEYLCENKIITQPHRYVESGYVTIPICYFI